MYRGGAIASGGPGATADEMPTGRNPLCAHGKRTLVLLGMATTEGAFAIAAEGEGQEGSEHNITFSEQGVPFVYIIVYESYTNCTIP